MRTLTMVLLFSLIAIAGYSTEVDAPVGRIAFESRGRIFVMDADGGNLTQLSTTTGWASRGWSPDEKYFVFTKGDIEEGWTIFIRDADGSNVTQLTTEDSSSPVWCPTTTSPTTPAPAVHLRVVVDSLRLRDEPNTGLRREEWAAGERRHR